MLGCPAGAILSLQCGVYNAANIMQVKWHHRPENGNLTELNTTTGGRYIVSVSPNQGCTGGDWRLYQLTFDYNETDSGSYWCQIVTAGNIHLELPWMVDTINLPNVTTCANAGGTDSKCVAQPTATPTLSSTAVFAQDFSTSAEGATTKPLVSATTTTHRPVETPSSSTVPSASPTSPSTTLPSTGCTVGGTSCFVYLAAGLGVVVVLLVVVVIALVWISVKRGKNSKKGKGEKKSAYFSRHGQTTWVPCYYI